MKFALNDTHLEYAGLAAEFFAETADFGAVRNGLDTANEPAPGIVAMARLGLTGILAPEAVGGLGGSVLDSVVVAEHAGRYLSSPSMTSITRASIILTGADDLQKQLATGALRVAVVDSGEPTIDALHADLFLHRVGDEIRIGPGVIRPQPPIDASRGLALVDAAGRSVVHHDGVGVWDRALDVARIVLAAEGLGTAKAALDLALGHVRTRETFGRTIGSYQAIKHRLVDVWTDIEQLQSLLWWAGWVADEDPDNLALAASASKALSSSVVEAATELAVHVHGGMGFTWEHDAHLYWRRAKVDRLLLGNRSSHLDRVARLALARAAQAPFSVDPVSNATS